MTIEVGSFPPNNFSLHDVLGNVWEWTDSCSEMKQADSFPSKLSPEKRCDPVLRGGSFATQAEKVKTHSRATYPAHLALPSFGFRVLREL